MALSQHIIDACPDLAVLLRVFYLAASALIIVIEAVPALKSRFLAYGSRAASPASGPRVKEKPSKFPRLLDSFASIRVPHNWFTHFYVTSVLSSLFWGWKLGIWPKTWDTLGPTQLAWLLMLVQGIRRLAESYAYTSSSKSEMWFGHWLLGIIFYLAINMSIWAESDLEPTASYGNKDAQSSSGWRLALLPPAILTCHALQHSYHAYLYRLRTTHSTYQLPSHPLFPNLLCPHYTCESLIYLFLSFLAAPTGRWVNWTLFCAFIFVAVNLGVTAIGTKEWYEQRFGAEKVRHRRRMVPWLW